MRPECESSYGWSGEDKDGWPERYYYSYYTTLAERTQVSMTLETMLFAIIMLCSLIANVTIIVSILRRKEMQTVTNCFIVNLGFADLIFVLSIPAIAVARTSPSWILGQAACKILPYSQFVCGSVLLWTLTAISVDRVRCLGSAPYRSGLTRKTCVILIIIAWIVALLIFLPVAIFFREQNVQYKVDDEDYNQITQFSNATICTLVFPPINHGINTSLLFTLTMVICSCILPMCLLIYNFQIIFRKLAEIQQRLEEKLGNVNEQPSKLRLSIQAITGNLMINSTSSNNLESSVKQANLIRHPSMGSFHRLKKHKRAVRILFCNIFAVLAMWLPICVVMFLIYEDGHRRDNNFFLSNQYFIWSVILALMNTIVNPIIYGFLTENFRDACPLHRWFSRHTCIKWEEGQNSDTQNNSSSHNSKNVTTQHFCIDNPIAVETRDA